MFIGDMVGKLPGKDLATYDLHSYVHGNHPDKLVT